ncbi:leucine-rich melanocyte differentiation-associated protein-like isoform X2 [Cydia strobilella]|uniref:leucine-rich melanocyte differentiation-associated protein-like isoform X2 n=1 Tax=Cydia strobilella TaxID=1100964 RepID=UPI003006ED17
MTTEGNVENGEDPTRLTLAYERLYEIPRTIVERFADHVWHLDISHNKITVNYCKIGSLYPWVAKLKESCPNLQYLCLMGNPAAPSYLNGGNFYDYLQYRLFVISQFPSLNHLDDRKVTEDQRAEAQRLYKRPFFERIVKPSSGGISQLIHAPVKWSSFQNKITSLWAGKEERNLLI